MKKNITEITSTSKILLIAIFFAGGSFIAEAAVKISSDFKDGIIKVEGACEKDVLIELFSDKKMSEVIYSAGAACKGGKFSFSDNLTKWNIVEGSYILVVDGQRIKDKEIEVKKEKDDRDIILQKEEEKDEEKIQKNQDIVVGDLKKAEPSEKAISEFDKATENLKESMDNMNESLEAMDENYSESKYANNSFVRTIIDLMKETFKTISGLFMQLVTTQSDNNDVQAVENNVVEKSVKDDSGVSIETGEIQPAEIE